MTHSNSFSLSEPVKSEELSTTSSWDGRNGFCVHPGFGGFGIPVVEAFSKGSAWTIFPELPRGVPSHIAAFFWGILRTSPACIARGRHFLYSDYGYFKRERFSGYYRIVLNGFQQNFVKSGCPSDRFNALGISQSPWGSSKAGAGHILVCPPSRVYAEVFDLGGWFRSTIERIRSVTDRKIVIREKTEATKSPLSGALRDAHILVTHNSNAAVEAVFAGVPVCVSPVSAAYPMSTPLEDIERPHMPDRTEWLNSLAYSQFTLDEMRSGKALALIRERL